MGAHCMCQQPNQIENLRINQSQPPRGYLTNRDALHFKLTTTPRASVIILALHCDSVSIAPVALADLNQFCAINAPPALLSAFPRAVRRQRCAQRQCTFITGKGSARATCASIWTAITCTTYAAKQCDERNKQHGQRRIQREPIGTKHGYNVHAQPVEIDECCPVQQHSRQMQRKKKVVR